MKPTYKTIIRNYFHRFQADVAMAAYTNTRYCAQEEHSPEFYRFWFIVRGAGVLAMNGRQHTVKPGQLYLLPPGSQHSIESDSEESIGMYWCHFRADIGDLQLFEMLRLPVHVEPYHSERSIELFENMIRAYHSRSFARELRLRAALLELLACYLEFCEMREQTLQQFDSLEKIDRVLEYIDERLSGNIGVEELAKLAFLHPNYFISFFKNMVGCSPIQYVNLRRMEEAKRLLEDSIEPVSAVARQVGLQNHYLSRLFKQHVGLSPTRYRQIHRSGKSALEGENGER